MELKKSGDLYLDHMFDHRQRWIWSSDQVDKNAAWVVGFDVGACHDLRVDDAAYVRVVRGG